MNKTKIEHLHKIEVCCREILSTAGSSNTVPSPVATIINNNIKAIRHVLKQAGLVGPDKYGRLFTKKYYNKQKWIKNT